MKRTARFYAACLLFVLLPILAVTAAADAGPKPEVTVRVVNPPAVYYLDLLYEGEGDYDNLRETRDSCDPTMLAALFSLEDAGWHPALAGGTMPPMWGSLTGVPDGSAMRHTFG
ncbi:MAG TPA: hypothetical protein PK597_02095 [Oscillospiraceae bacterium]|nr:hypothetical protein [Oscillospiraceae bacterium]